MKSIYKVPLKFGLSGAGVIILMFVIFQVLGSNPLTEMGMLDIFVLPVFLFFTIKEYRDNHNNGLLEFKHGMSLGFMTYSTIAVVSGLFTWIFLEVTDPNIMKDYVAISIENLNEVKEEYVKDMDTETLSKLDEKIANTSAFDIALDGLLKKLLIGFLLTSFLAVILKRNPEQLS